MLGHNNPPDAIDEAVAPFGDAIEEAQQWLDGKPIENDDQLAVASHLLAEIKAAAKAVDEAAKLARRPLHDAWKSEIDRWKPTQDDLARLISGLIEIQRPYKAAKDAEKERARRKAHQEAQMAKIAAENAANSASMSDIDAQREADRLRVEAIDAQKAANAAAKDKIPGMRKVWRYEVTDHRAALHWIAINDRDSLTLFVNEYARKNHGTKEIDGVISWQERKAF